MGKSVAETARLADGWLPIFFDPEKFQQVWGDDLEPGMADRDPSLGAAADLGRRHGGHRRRVRRRRRRPGARHAPARLRALYVGGMGARDKNFYNSIAKKYGYVDEATEIQDLYLSGQQGGGGGRGAARAAGQHQPRRAGGSTSTSASPPTRRRG